MITRELELLYVCILYSAVFNKALRNHRHECLKGAGEVLPILQKEHPFLIKIQF